MELPRLIEALSQPSAYAGGVDAVEVHQTHISAVFLAGSLAYKLKKPVTLGFVDYGTIERRRHFCEEEVRLNRRLAPEVYHGVVPGARGPRRSERHQSGRRRRRCAARRYRSAFGAVPNGPRDNRRLLRSPGLPAGQRSDAG